MQTTIYKTEKPERPTVEHSELQSISYNNYKTIMTYDYNLII